MEQYINIEFCIHVIQQYILEIKGVLVNIQPPYTLHQQKLFIKALDSALIYYGKEL